MSLIPPDKINNIIIVINHPEVIADNPGERDGFILEKILIFWIIALGLGTVLLFRHLNDNFYKHLFELETVFNDKLDFTRLSKNVLTMAMKKTGATGGLLYWYDDARQEYKLKTLQKIPTEIINLITKLTRRPGGVMERIGQQSAGFLINNLLHEAGYGDFPEIKSIVKYYKSILVVPLKSQPNTQGIMVLLKAGCFAEKQLAVLKIFAPRAAVHLDNARLYQLTKETAVENARLYLNLSKMFQKATSDELTGLYNRNFLMQRLKEELKKAFRFKQPLSIIFTDIDFFKKINDQYGHQTGDRLLREFGSLLKDSLREYDVICRYGGEEFVILLPHTTLENSCELAERLRLKTADHHFCLPEAELTITSSFGVSSLPDYFGNATPVDEDINIYIENLIACADQAMYLVKKSGRNGVRFSVNNY